MKFIVNFLKILGIFFLSAHAIDWLSYMVISFYGENYNVNFIDIAIPVVGGFVGVCPYIICKRIDDLKKLYTSKD